MLRGCLLLGLCLFVGGCATHQTASVTPDVPAKTDAQLLADDWLLENGPTDYIATITVIDDNHVMLGPARLIWSGIYEVTDDRLVITKPNYPAMAGYVWQRTGKHRMQLMTTDYAGCTMTRPYANWN